MPPSYFYITTVLLIQVIQLKMFHVKHAETSETLWHDPGIFTRDQL